MKICITCNSNVDELDLNLECFSCESKFARKMQALVNTKIYKGTGKIPLPIEEIQAKYLAGATLEELARKYNVSSITIRNRISLVKKPKPVIDIEKVKVLLKKHNIKEISQILRVSYHVLYKKVRELSL